MLPARPSMYSIVHEMGLSLAVRKPGQQFRLRRYGLKTFGVGKNAAPSVGAGWGAEIIVYPPGTDVPIK
jgi:hypothetical protein